jgi:hypothetical protein
MKLSPVCARSVTDSNKSTRKLNGRFIAFQIHIRVSCGVRDKIKEQRLSLSSMDVVKGD